MIYKKREDRVIFSNYSGLSLRIAPTYELMASAGCKPRLAKISKFPI